MSYEKEVEGHRDTFANDNFILSIKINDKSQEKLFKNIKI